MRRYTLKDNILSALLGGVLAIPLCVCSARAWAGEKKPVDEMDVRTVETLYEANTSSHTVSLDIVPVIHEETPEEIEEELYYDSLELMACIVEAEAGNQGLLGKRLVADVILNRVDDPDFPDTIWDVLTQPYHFSTYWNEAYMNVTPTEETYQAIQMEIDERSYPSLLFFTAGNYSDYGTPWKQVGDHYFSTK